MSAVVVTAGFSDDIELTAVRIDADRVGPERYAIRADNPGGGFHLGLSRGEATRLRDQLTQALEDQ